MGLQSARQLGNSRTIPTLINGRKLPMVDVLDRDALIGDCSAWVKDSEANGPAMEKRNERYRHEQQQ